MRSTTLLSSSREVAYGCGVSFINWLYLVPLIIGQNFCATCANLNQTGPKNWQVGQVGGDGITQRRLRATTIQRATPEQDRLYGVGLLFAAPHYSDSTGVLLHPSFYWLLSVIGSVWMIWDKFISRKMFYSYHLSLIVLAHKSVWIRSNCGWEYHLMFSS